MGFAPASPKQQTFLNSNDPLDGSEKAFITLFGGAAGSGKSYLGVMAMLKYTNDPKFRGCITRLNSVMLKGSGGLFDTAVGMYSEVEPKIRINTKEMKIKFPSGAQIEFKHYEHSKNWIDWQGLQLSLTLIDEASQYSEDRIEYVISRLRTEAKVDAHLLMTANPDYDSILRVWLEKGGYLDKKGFPLAEMDGVITYTGQVAGERQFTKTREEFKELYPTVEPQTFRFLPATIYDNPPLMEMEPGYLTTLENLPRVSRDRLLLGNWYAREEAAGYWKREWCGDAISLYQIPKGLRSVRSWDMAATLPSEVYPDPDFTVGVRGCVDGEGTVYITDVRRFRDRPAGVISKLLQAGKDDGQDCTITIPKDPGAAGKAAADNVTSKCFEAGFTCRQKQTKTGKDKRFEPVAALAENGMIKIVKGDWNKLFHDELEAFGSGRGHDDIVDAIADLVHELCQRRAIPNFACPTGMTKENPFQT